MMKYTVTILLVMMIIACQVAPPAVAGNISNTVCLHMQLLCQWLFVNGQRITQILVGDTVYLTCLTDDADITYTLDGTYPSLQNDSAEVSMALQ